MLTRSLARPGLVLLTALLALCPPLVAQRLGSIGGTITTAVGTKRSGIEGARVVLVGTPFVVHSNSKGEFSFNGLAPGKYTIRASAIGYGTMTSPIEVKALELLEIDFEADPEAVRLPDLEAEDKPNLPPEFLRRSREGGGRYFFRADIERRAPPTVADLLRTVAGMRIECGGPVCRAIFARSTRNCQPAYFMDGAPVDPAVVWLQPPRDLDGVEVYSGPATVPPELNRYGGCGAIVLWTRTPPPRIKKEKKPPVPKDPPAF